MNEPSILVNRDAEGLAHAVAARLITKLVDVQSNGGVAQVVLTGGRVAAVVYRAVAESPARTAIDWRRVEFWWGDERFLPDGDPERNETQARDALLSRVDVDPARVHPMAADSAKARKQPPKLMQRSWQLQPALRVTGWPTGRRCSTSSCLASGRTAMSLRCSPGIPRARSWTSRRLRCMTPPSRRRPASR